MSEEINLEILQKEWWLELIKENNPIEKEIEKLQYSITMSENLVKSKFKSIRAIRFEIQEQQSLIIEKKQLISKLLNQ